MQKILQTDQSVIDEVERTKWRRSFAAMAKDWRLYVLLVPMFAFLICFKYLPIVGLLDGFKWGTTGKLHADEWCGLYWVQEIFVGDQMAPLFWKAFRNTFVNSMYGLIFGFPIPIILALLFSEVKVMWFRSVLQVAAYLPHFVSTVVVTSIISLWCMGTVGGEAGGWLYKICLSLKMVTAEQSNTLLYYPKFFRPIYQVSGIWEGAGYGSIVYFAAVLAISPTSYEAARIDGASKMQQIRYVTFPGMAPTLVIMLIMRIGQILNIGYEKIILLMGGSPASAWENAEVVSTLVYKLTKSDDSVALPGDVPNYTNYGIVMDLFNSIIAMCLVLGANAISRRVSSTSLF